MKQFTQGQIVIGTAIVLVAASVSFSITRKLIGTDLPVTEAPSGAVELPEEPVASLDSETTSEITTFDWAELAALQLESSRPVSPPDSTPVEPQKLEKPLINAPSGGYHMSEFPIKVRITNPNDESTWLMVSINRGGFREFEGGLIRLHPDDYVEAYARGDTEHWVESETVSLYCKRRDPPPRPQRVIRVPVRRLQVGGRR